MSSDAISAPQPAASVTTCCSPTTTTRRRRRSRRRPGQPNRIRCIRDERWKYAVYLDPTGRVAPEYELYDLDADPDEALNLVEVRGAARARPQAARELPRLAARWRSVRPDRDARAGAAAGALKRRA